jgi:hypothetical protein
VRSMPSCERPYSLYTAFTGSAGQEADAPQLITLCGVPAAEFEHRIELSTKHTAVAVFATPERARKVVERCGGPATPAQSQALPLPAPAEDIVATKLTTVQCAS